MQNLVLEVHGIPNFAYSHEIWNIQMSLARTRVQADTRRYHNSMAFISESAQKRLFGEFPVPRIAVCARLWGMLQHISQPWTGCHCCHRWLPVFAHCTEHDRTRHPVYWIRRRPQPQAQTDSPILGIKSDVVRYARKLNCLHNDPAK